ncbi:MAG TPA: DUF2203 domain-containing protein [Actinomycetota bacterium]|nr:DUF2203 domain-containing protein [Actinomycetota bacterium]
MSDSPSIKPGAERIFTVEEANDLLPWLRDVLPRVREARQVILGGGERIRRTSPLNGGGAFSREYWDALSSLRRDVEQLATKGIILRDADTGLVDFPAQREGNQILLCWRLGEGSVAFWHSPQSGFSGRRAL